jgi:hypothetical protein
MKQLTIALLLFIPGFIHSQSDSLKLPKLYVTEKFSSIGFELGEKEIEYNQVAPHLKIHNAEAYHLWMKQESNMITGIVFTALASAGALTGLLSKKREVKAVGWSAAVVSLSATYVFNSSAKNKRTKAVNIYNKGAGY